MNDVVTRRLQGLGLLAAIVGVSAIAILIALIPVIEAREAMLDARKQVERFEESLIRDRESQVIDTSQIIHAKDLSETSLAVQRLLVDLVQSSGLTQLQMTTLTPKRFDRGIVQQPFRLQLSGDLDQMTSLLVELSKQRPMVFVDSLEFAEGSAHRGDLAMRIDLEASAYARDAGSKP